MYIIASDSTYLHESWNRSLIIWLTSWSNVSNFTHDDNRLTANITFAKKSPSSKSVIKHYTIQEQQPKINIDDFSTTS